MFVSKWHMNRMGLVDFWYYVNEEFYFKDGHMLLRGSNGSGKSVTMQSFIPLILDGNKSSERLDSFGTKSRKIENYLLEEDGERDDRIGYLYLEFKREDADIYKTIGIGLHARRNKQLDSWYFVIEDNRRINMDIKLMDHDLTITKQMLKNIIGSQLIEGQKEYMERVNTALFGFASLSDYKDAITLLIQLRSPKLSNSLKPTIINTILSDSLQPLSEDDLRPMSEAIANMDEIKDQLDALKESFIAAKALGVVYDQYNHAVLDMKALYNIDKTKAFSNTQNEIKEQILKEEQSVLKLKESEKKLVALRNEQSVLNEEKTSLLKQDMRKLVDEIEQHVLDKKAYQDNLNKKEALEEDKDNQCMDAKIQVKQQHDKKDEKERQINNLFKELNVIQETIQFEEHTALCEDVLGHLHQSYDYTYSEQRIKEELQALQEGNKLFVMIDNIKQQQTHLLNDLETQQITKENIEKDLQAYQDMFTQLQEEYKEKFSTWNSQNRFLQLDSTQILDIYKNIQLYESEDSYGKIDSLIHKVYIEQYQKQLQIKTNTETSLHSLIEQISEIQTELSEWKNMKEPTPEMDMFMTQNRVLLKENKIAYQPLYKLLDYHEEVSQELKNTFEEMLFRSGLLNAIVVSTSDKEKILSLDAGTADNYLFMDGKVDHQNVFFITETVALQNDIKSLFQAMHIQGSQMQGHGSYFDTGVYIGTISKQVETKFIGEVSRENYRKLKISQLEEAYSHLNLEKEQVKIELEAIKQDICCLEEEIKKYPKKDDLEAVKQSIHQSENDLNNVIQRIQSITVELNVKNQEIDKQQAKINVIAGKLGIDTTKDIFLTRETMFYDYERILNEVRRIHQEYLSAYEVGAYAQIRYDDLIKDLDNIRYEIDEIKQQLDKLTMRINQKQQQLDHMGYEEVKKRIEVIQKRLSELPNEISNVDQSIGTLKQELLDYRNNIAVKNEELKMHQVEKEEADHNYLEELNLHYVVNDDTSNNNAITIHRLIEKKYPNLKRKDTLLNELQTSFHNHRGILQEYNLSLVTLFQTLEATSRLDITARYQGMKINFFQLLENLQLDIEKQSVLLEDSDRALIEDILVNTISKKIRTRIQNSKRWVQVMNRYMNEMNTSSGLKLNLQWSSHKAENDEEMNSEKLVELLEKDVKILKDSDRKRLSSHFRSKITTARKICEQQDTHASFHQVMKTVMDYRTWFDFRILAQKTGEKKKELTNNTFYAFSGGEKAMAMYIPLFSAVAAKFEGAREDAPLLITLDEAFAGVDEKNINNMFALIGKFNFDYIMNSQVLWGDYPSVKSLAIHELYRPENARYITIISYEWNGHVKVMVDRT